jgi:hypothetical protein
VTAYLLPPGQVQLIFPAGLQGNTLLYNAGANPLYVDSDLTVGVSSFPISPGGSLPWDAGVPLYAVSPAGTTMNVAPGSSTVFDPTAIATAILDQGLAQDIATSISLNPPTVIVQPPALLYSGMPGGAWNPAGGTASVTVTPSAGTTSMDVAAPVGLNGCVITVMGVTTGLTYVQTPYVNSGNYVPVPIDPQIDASYLITISWLPLSAGRGNLVVTGRSDGNVLAVVGSPESLISAPVGTAPAQRVQIMSVIQTAAGSGSMTILPAIGSGLSYQILGVALSLAASGAGANRATVNDASAGNAALVGTDIYVAGTVPLSINIDGVYTTVGPINLSTAMASAGSIRATVWYCLR